ncbi:MAG: hypothetical protein DBX90_00175 [Lentisphaerae bacterium]|nr:MAG: hypothetical protein DBX90_00175 [Lentisphaerota bacterium]
MKHLRLQRDGFTQQMARYAFVEFNGIRVFAIVLFWLHVRQLHIMVGLFGGRRNRDGPAVSASE